MSFVTRFAPSPTGPLHLGHAYSALLAHDMARAAGGRFLLRIEDIDAARSRPEWEAQIYHDLRWLGLRWEEPVLRQSERSATYDGALSDLAARGLIYPCSCRRRDIRAAVSAPQEGVAAPPVYPGTCRGRAMASRKAGDALRLDLARALASLTDRLPLRFEETGAAMQGSHAITAEILLRETGDPVLARKDVAEVSYLLAAVIDDAEQAITMVIRGADLFETTFPQVLLQALLDLPTPIYHHHRLIRDAEGKRLAKRDDARAISTYRAEGASPEGIRAMVGLPPTPDQASGDISSASSPSPTAR